MTLADGAVEPEEMRRRFHDVSTYGDGLLVHVRDGGLERDLSRALYDSPSPVTGRIFTDPDQRGPNWDIARSWASLKVESTGFPTAPVVQAHRENNSAFGSTAQHGVGPLISRWGVEWWIRMVRVSGAPGEAASRYALGIGIRPVLQLTNPYNVRLPARAYRLSHNFGQDGSSGLRWQVVAKNMEFSWAKMLGIRSSSPLLNGLGVNDGSRPWFNL